MKTLKSMVAGIALLLACITANATVKSRINQPTEKDVVNMYINAITNAKADDLDKILDNDLQFNMHRGDNVNTLNKNQLVDYVKNNTIADNSVSTTTTVLADDDAISKVKIEFKYNGFTRTDIVTLNKALGWKIAVVNSSNN